MSKKEEGRTTAIVNMVPSVEATAAAQRRWLDSGQVSSGYMSSVLGNPAVTIAPGEQAREAFLREALSGIVQTE